ncbi:MAG: HTTM domain-containing protein [Proteobacteria bacterium]|nr:HTTM domain-containing protein [Pseudomonadota bacterium]
MPASGGAGLRASLSSGAERFFLAPTLGRSLAALRIVVGGAMLYEALSLFPYINDLYGRYGYLQAELIEALTGHAIPGTLAKMGMSSSAHSTLLQGFYFVHLALAFLVLAGYKTRQSTIGLWITQSIILASGYFSSYGVDRYFHNALFALAWLPAGNCWSVDRFLSETKPEPLAACRLGRRLLQIFLLMTYADAGISKMYGTDWWDGEAVWRVVNQPEFRRFDFLWLAQMPWLCVGLSRGTVFIEALYGIGAWIPKVGRLWTLAIIGMHLSIAVAMRLSLFGTTLALMNAALFLVPDEPPSERPR